MSVNQSTRTNLLYRSPSRTTQRTTTVTYEDPSTESTDSDQEDPKVIKELIDLIKKVGGVEELERQLNLQDDGTAVTLSLKTNQQDARSTTPASIISKQLYDKIKNRASVLKTRPAFNGASQPELKVESEERLNRPLPTSTTEGSTGSKKYNTVNRFSRPSPQNAGIDSLPESDAVLVEKPAYTSIRRKPAAKPAIIAENDYNGESENLLRELSTEGSRETEPSKKYASINRQRRPQAQTPVVKSGDTDEEGEDFVEIVSTTAKPTSKYVSLSRRRQMTAVPENER